MTTAIALWLIFASAVASFLGWAVWAVGQGVNPWWFVAAAPLAAAAIPVALATVYFALAWVFRTPRPPEHRIGCAASARLLANEVAAIALSWPRMALFRWLTRDPAPAPAAAPVILLHGVLCNAGVWRGLRAYLAERGIAPVYTLTVGPPLASIEDFSEQLAARVDAVLAATAADRVALVGHSMGGLVARAYLRRYGAAKIAFVMTLGTPHHGSVHAWLFPGTPLAQLRPGNPWLAELNRTEGDPTPVRFVSLWSWHDSMVAPQASSRFAGAVNIELDGIGHNALLDDRRVFEAVATELRMLRAVRQGN
jgi:triacylglycerol esterase/lipase EstA (alpha/beta hydrolase family)